MKKRFFKSSNSLTLLLLVLTWALMGLRSLPHPQSNTRLPLPAVQSASELVAAVNALRAENGLGALTASPILMQVAQQHAEYMAATGQITHYSADGKRPFQRALDAGFPVAGDLSLGGYYAENITAGRNRTPAEAVQSWMSDDPHMNTMLTSWASHIGAGVAFNGDMVYYVLDTALYSNQPVSQTQAPGDDPTAWATTEGTQETAAWKPAAPLALNTAAPDGSIHHTVQEGETLWSIAAVYGLSVEDLASLNAMLPDQFIHAGDSLLIQAGATPTITTRPTTASTRTPTRQPQRTQIPSSTAQVETLAVTLLPTATSLFPAENPTDTMGTIVPVVITICLLLAVAIFWHGLRRGAGH
jgi:LysM repeat protein